MCYALCMHGLLWWIVLFSICFAVPNRNRLCTSGGKDSLCSMQTVDVIRAGLDTHQDNLVTIFGASHSFISRENNLRDVQNLSNQEPSEAVQQQRYQMSDTFKHIWKIQEWWQHWCEIVDKSITFDYLSALCPTWSKNFTVHVNVCHQIYQYQSMRTARPLWTSEQQVNNGGSCPHPWSKEALPPAAPGEAGSPLAMMSWDFLRLFVIVWPTCDHTRNAP